jgi:DNA-binding NarL/FixJ family response regulator
MERIRLLIADDHPVVRVGLRGMLAEQPDLEVIAEAQTGEEAVELAERHLPRVVLMDLRMPEMDGVEATARITARHPEVRVLILTTYESDSDILRALETGATGYLLKDAPRQELFAAIRNAAQGKPPLAPAVAARLIERLRTPPEEVLSAREIEVLELVAQGKSNPDIAGELWISETTVKSHMIHIFEKLGVADRTAAVTVALRRRILRLEP